MRLFNGTLEQELYLNQKNTQIKNTRIKEIRKQEDNNVKKQLSIKQQQLKKQQEEEELKKKYEDYLQKLALIEELNRQKEQSLIEIGRAQREAEQFKIKQQEEQIYKEQMQLYYDQQAVLRYQQAADWNKQQFQNTQVGKSMSLNQQRKDAYQQERSREQQSLLTYKEQYKNRTTISNPEMESYEKFDKNIPKRQVLKPEDFANTCFHNPQVIKHDPEEQENAMEKANTTFVESQTVLLEKAKQQREAERAQKERSRKALLKEQQSKLLEQLEIEAKFIKQQEVKQIQQTKPPIMKNKSQKQKQKELNSAFNQMFGEKIDGAGIVVKSHKAKSNSPKKKSALKEKKRPKSVKIFTKAPLDSNLYKDYTDYALASPEQQSAKKRVQFDNSEDQEEYELPLKQSQQSQQQYSEQQQQQQQQSQKQQQQQQQQSLYQQKQSPSDYSPTQQYSYQEDEEIETSQNEEIESQQEQTLQKQNQIGDIRSYIQEQELYLQKLEQQRINTQMKMKNEETNLVNSFKATRQFMKNSIPEESDEESSMQQSSAQKQSLFENQSNLLDLDSEDQQVQFKRTSDQQNGSQDREIQSSEKYPRSSGQFYSSPDTFNNSPLLQQQNNSEQFETIDNLDPKDLMQQFLKPKRMQQQFEQREKFQQQQQKLQNQLIEKQNNLLQQQNQEQNYFSSSNQNEQFQLQTIQDSSERNSNQLQFLLSPNTDLNYSVSDGKKDKLSPLKVQSSERIQDDQDNEETLGEIFQKRKAMLAKKLEQRQEQKVDKGGKSKEELIQIRKEMMKSKKQVEREQNNSSNQNKNNNNNNDTNNRWPQNLQDAEEDKRSQLMRRLAMGEKVKVEKKEMLELTNKNYGQLPEVLKKKENHERSESIKQRKQKVKEMDQRLRETMKQKR